MVEVHHRPSRPFWLAPVSAESLFRSAVPSATGVQGILAPEPAAHAVLVVAHAWIDDPLGKVGQLLDAASPLASADHGRAGAFARAWGWEEMWKTTLSVIDCVVGAKRRTLAHSLWARHLRGVRERVVLENHISRLAAPIWSLPARDVPRALAWAFATRRHLRPVRTGRRSFGAPASRSPTRSGPGRSTNRAWPGSRHARRRFGHPR
jgi:hypothetical protein